MKKKIVIVSASFRKSGNSNALVKEFTKGAKEAKNTVSTIFLADKKIGFCHGCLACQKTHRCVIQDDMPAIAKKIGSADVVVFASPVYYYSISGQLKTMLDRCNPLYGSKYSFRKVILLACAADDASSAVDGSMKAIQGWVDCFEKAKLTKVIFAKGVNELGDIQEHPALRQAYLAGKAIR